MEDENQLDIKEIESPEAAPVLEETEEPTEVIVVPEFNLQISADRMEATLRVVNASSVKSITEDEVFAFLKERNISYGICENTIRRFCESGELQRRVICAKGLRPIHGINGTIEYKFVTEQELKPKEREDGTVDFRDLDLIQNVRKGTVLCQCTPPTPGKDGIDVCNNPVAHKPGKCPDYPLGSGTVVSDDKLSLIAAIDGCIEYKNRQLNINDVFTVRGNVDNVSGNINTVSSVLIQGDVLEGFSVKSEKDITIRGMVEGAIVEAKGSILISNGMNGMGRGVLKAGGNIAAKYFENATIIGESDVCADVMMNCKVTTEGSIVLKGKNSLLVGGSYQAGSTIVTKNIGNASHTKTMVSIKSKKLDEIFAMNEGPSSIEELQSKQAELQQELEDLQQKIVTITTSVAADNPRSMDIKKQLMSAVIAQKAQITAAIESVEKEIELAEEQKAQFPDFKVVVSGITYPGTKLEIGIQSVQIENENSNTKFYADKDRIVFAPVLPSDMG